MRTLPIPAGCFLTLVFSVAAATDAQDSATPALPSGVTRLLNSETIAVGRVDLHKLDLANAMPLIAEWGRMPAADAAMAAAVVVGARQTILNAGGSHLFAIVSLENFPTQPVTVVLPLNSKLKDDAELVKALFAGQESEVIEQAVVVKLGDRRSRRESVREAVERAPAQPRPEFAQALQAVDKLPIQLALALSADGRRVVREMFPQQPSLFGEFTGSVVTDGVKWLAIGLNLARQPSVEIVVQSQDAEAARRLHAAVTSGLKTLAQSEPLKKAVPFDLSSVTTLLSPKLAADRLTVSLNESNGGASRLIDDLLKPLARKSQQAAGQSQSVNNLKQLGLAMHNYHDVHKSFPPAASVSKDGRKLLSWRVHLLPYLDGNDLYKQFHLDESWDSEHNKKLIDQMPPTFASPLAPPNLKAKGMTTYLAPIGDKTILNNPKGTAIKEIIDGTSLTILIVEANAEHAVIWTKPEDLSVDFKNPIAGLTGQVGDSFRTVFADGAARAISTTIPAETLRRLMQMNDREPIGDF